MSESTTVIVSSVEHKDNGWYELKDGNDVLYSTKKPEIGDPAKALIGKQALLTFTVSTKEKDGRTFTNRFLDSVEAVEANGDHPPLGTGEYVKGQTAPADARRMLLCNAWNNALELTKIQAERTTVEWTPATLFTTTERYAKDIWASMQRDVGLLDEGDIPF